MNGKYVCSICGKDYNELNFYLDCVSTCGKKLKKEQEEAEAKKRAEEVNVALNEIKQAKAYLEQKKAEFKKKYPEEYEMNFGKGKCSCGNCTCDESNEEDCLSPLDDSYKSIEVSVKDDGKGKPEVNATVNGKKVDDNSIEKLFEDPETRYLAKLLGIL